MIRFNDFLIFRLLFCYKKEMKKLIIYSVLFVCGVVVYAQLKPKDIFSQNEVVWYGLDFSKSKFIGSFENLKGTVPISAEELIMSYIPAWNNLIVSEPLNFDIENTFWKKSVYYDLKSVESINSKIPRENLITLNSHVISKTELPEMVALYKKGDKKEGLGLSFIIESFDKPRLEASLWVVFFDIESKKVLLSKHCTGEPFGFGLRNYWAGSIKHIMNDIRFRKFQKWSRETTNETDALAITK
jgi:hypothetical protein